MTASSATDTDDASAPHHRGGEKRRLIDAPTLLNPASQISTNGDDSDDPPSPTEAPAWVRQQHSLWGEPLVVKEWEESSETLGYRESNGWVGCDLVHSPSAPVRISGYAAKYGDGVNGLSRGGVGTTLTGVAEFTPRAESHKGYCHGGSMCSVFDDIIGWVGFLTTGQCLPWSGYTVQVNSSLTKPVKVNSVLKISATIVKVERRKVYVEARLIDPLREEGNGVSGLDDEVVHATAEGLVILNKGILPEVKPKDG